MGREHDSPRGDSYQADLEEREIALDRAWGAPEHDRDAEDHRPLPRLRRASELSDPDLPDAA